MKYYMLKYSDDLPEGFGGTTQGPVIKIRPKYKGDMGLLEHEKTHVRQWYALTGLGLVLTVLLMLIWPAFWPAGAVGPFIHSLLYKNVQPYRQWCEVQAYREQLAMGGYTNSDFAVTALIGKYGLSLDTQEANALLRG